MSEGKTPPDRRSRLRSLGRLLVWGLAVFYFLFGALIISTRWYLLPQIGKHKEDVAALLSERSGARVTIGEISPSWKGLWPRVTLRDVRLEKPSPGRQASEVLVLPHVTAQIAWRSVLGTPSFRSLLVEGMHLSVRRTGPKTFEFGGFTADFSDASPGSGDALSRLFDQGSLSVTGASVSYEDLTQKEPRRITATRLSATLERTSLGGFAFGLQGLLEDREERSVDLRAEVRAPFFGPKGDPLSWKGRLFADIRSFDLGHGIDSSPLPDVIREGTANLRAWADFSEGTITAAQADVQARNLKLQFPDRAPLTVPQASARAEAVSGPGSVVWTVRDLLVKLPGVSKPRPLQIRAERSDGTDGTSPRVQVEVSFVDLAATARIARSLPMPEAAADWLDAQRPRGIVRNLRVSWPGGWNDAAGWKAEAGLEDVVLASGKKQPGFSGLSGRVRCTAQEGTLSLDARKFTAHLPGVFPADDVPADTLTGAVRWKMDAGALQSVSFDRVRAANADADAEVSGTWTAGAGPGVIDLTGTVHRAQAASAWKYLPLTLSPEVRQWIRGGLAAGTGTNGKLVLRGDLRRYPWTGPGDDGEFSVTADVHGGAIDYLPLRGADGSPKKGPWPLLTDLEGRIEFRGTSFAASVKSAKTMNAEIRGGLAGIQDMTAERPVLAVHGETKTDLGRLAAYLPASPLKDILPGVLTGLKGSGPAELRLDLGIPLSAGGEVTASGSVKLAGARAAFGHPVPELTDAHGTVVFTHRSVFARGLQARVFERPVTGELMWSPSTGLSLQARGRASAALLSWELGEDTPAGAAAAQLLEGDAQVSVDARRSPDGRFTLHASTDGEGLAVHLPEPLGKPAAEIAESTFELESGTRGGRVRLFVPGRVAAVVQLPGDPKAAPLGAVGLGTEPPTPVPHGVAVALQAGRVSLERWNRLLAALPPSESLTPSHWLGSIRADIEEIDAGDGKRFRTVRAAAHREKDRWRISANADEFSGLLFYYPDRGPHGELQAAFDLLHLPPVETDRLQSTLEDSRRLRLPALRATVRDLQIGRARLGQFTVKADNAQDSLGTYWKIDALAVENDAGTLTASGQWWRHGDKDFTEVQGLLTLKNGGRFLGRLGWPDVIRDAAGRVQVHLDWNGTPWSPDAATLHGKVLGDLEKGALQQVDPGAAGRLLSLVSMQTLLRYMTLDFSDLLGKGLVFDSIRWPMNIEKGVARIDNAKILGPQASLILEGSAHLATQRLDGRVLVLPDINAGGASLALAFVNPAAGIGSFLAQFLLRDPLSKLFAVEYAVSGTLDSPEVRRLDVRRPQGAKTAAPPSGTP